eukprot:2115193-Amphidinium_carterae.1
MDSKCTCDVKKPRVRGQTVCQIMDGIIGVVVSFAARSFTLTCMLHCRHFAFSSPLDMIICSARELDADVSGCSYD